MSPTVHSINVCKMDCQRCSEESNILALCDKLRDEQLIPLGVALDDQEDGKSAPPSELLKARDEKRAIALAKQVKKEAAKEAERLKRLERLAKGEAKPDFAERIIKEKETESEPPVKKPRLRYSKFSGTQASDMSPVTRENASQRAGWKVMPSGRVVRTMKMRPGKPLPPLPAPVKDSKDGKKKKKVKGPDTRARSKTIDVTKWDGSLLLREGLHGVGEERVQDKEKEERERKQILYEIVNVQALPDPLVTEPQSKPLPAPTVTTTTAPSHEDPSHSVDLLTEKAQTLSLLNSFLFSSSFSSKSKHDNISVD
ncbi:hypothetical protein F5879DRAFT_990567 [Lentinula edodes]|nr:hypothetical protein F5879DRAFT_990567 [Lentinula edodes]